MINDELTENDLNAFSEESFEQMTEVRNNTNPVVAEKYKNSFKEKLNSMGIKLSTDPNTITESAVPGGNVDLFQRIQRIKSGAVRGAVAETVKTFEKTAVPTAPPIHQPRKNKQQQIRNNQSPSVPSNAPKVQTFIPEGSGDREALAIASMFENDSPGYNISSGGHIQLEEENYGANSLPSFNPEEILRRKAASSGQPVQKVQKQALTSNLPQTEELVQIMETVSRRVSEDMLKKVLKELSTVFSSIQKQQTPKNVFEVYSKEKNIIKIGEQLYQITPVKIKGKS